MCAGELLGYDEMRQSAWARRWCRFALLLCAILFCISSAVCAQVSDAEDDASSKSWTATTDSKEDYANPTRTIRSHTQNGNRTVDVQSLQTRGGGGDSNPYQDIETETVRVSSTTTRTTTRTFVRDGDGKKTLFQVTEEEKQTFPGGNSKVVRATSSPDANGNLQVVQRENRETRKISPDVAETKTLIMLPSINGGLAPAMQIQERENRSGNSVETKKTTQLPDGTGAWQVAEVRHTTTQDDGKNRSKEESVSRPDLDGKLEEVTRRLGKESGDSSGGGKKSEET